MAITRVPSNNPPLFLQDFQLGGGFVARNSSDDPLFGFVESGTQKRYGASRIAPGAPAELFRSVGLLPAVRDRSAATRMVRDFIRTSQGGRKIKLKFCVFASWSSFVPPNKRSGEPRQLGAAS